ncbi:unnamed protein product, partial [Brassica oleracea var. botrytis]
MNLQSHSSLHRNHPWIVQNTQWVVLIDSVDGQAGHDHITPLAFLERLAQRRPHKMPNRRCKEQFKTSKGEADPKRKHFQFDVKQFCDNFVKGVDKALKDVNKSQKKSTSTRAPVAEPSIFISEKPKGKSENNVEDLKD